uniref:Uncharacterized protein n=1 Tax=Saimiri boliviensis boliviensis TaxID=39432 RepID=A0A2K6T8X9_SAIBB
KKRKTKTLSEGGGVLAEQRGSRSSLLILVFTIETTAACTDHFGW